MNWNSGALVHQDLSLPCFLPRELNDRNYKAQGLFLWLRTLLSQWELPAGEQSGPIALSAPFLLGCHSSPVAFAGWPSSTSTTLSGFYITTFSSLLCRLRGFRPELPIPRNLWALHHFFMIPLILPTHQQMFLLFELSSINPSNWLSVLPVSCHNSVWYTGSWLSPCHNHLKWSLYSEPFLLV